MEQQARRLVVESIRKRYKLQEVVRDVSLNFSSGEVVGLLGPNGAGKTTCFYIIVGLVRCDSGRILLEEHDITALPIHQRAKLGLTYLPQENSSFRRLTVAENVMAILELREPDAARRQQRLDELLNELHIDGIRDSIAAALSGGERRRMEIARALAADPSFILLDEPFAGVDPIAIFDVQRILRFLCAKNIGVLITDHNVRETLGICDRAFIISEGRVLSHGTPLDLVEDAEVRRVYLGENFRL